MNIPAVAAGIGAAMVGMGLLLIEPRGVLNTGDQGGERTAPNDVWV